MDASPTRPRRIAVLLAGGVGARIGLDIPKQLIKVAGKTLLEHTLAVLDQHPLVDEVIVMMAPGHLDAVRAIVRAGSYDKVRPIEEGGPSRNETTQRALAAIGDDEIHVLFHDAVRPLLSAADHHRVLRGAEGAPRGRCRDPLRRHHHRGRTRQHHPQHPPACCTPSRPDAAGVPVLGHPRAYALADQDPTSSRRPTTALWCCATCPTSRSGSSRATSGT